MTRDKATILITGVALIVLLGVCLLERHQLAGYPELREQLVVEQDYAEQLAKALRLCEDDHHSSHHGPASDDPACCYEDRASQHIVRKTSGTLAAREKK